MTNFKVIIPYQRPKLKKGAVPITQPDEEAETTLSKFDNLCVSKTLPLDDIWAIFACSDNNTLTINARTVVYFTGKF